MVPVMEMSPAGSPNNLETGQDISSQRIVQILTNNEFTFDTFLERDSLWKRYGCSKRMLLICSFIATGCLLVFCLPILCLAAKAADKVRLFFY